MCCSFKPNGNIVNVLHLHVCVNTLYDSLFALNTLWLSFQVSNKYLCIFFKGHGAWNYSTLFWLTYPGSLNFFFLAFDILNNAVVNNMVVLFLYSAVISLEYIYRGKIDRSNKRMHLKFWYIFSRCSTNLEFHQHCISTAFFCWYKNYFPRFIRLLLYVF